MKSEIVELNESKKEDDRHSEILARLFEKNIIDSEGNIL